MIGAIIGRLFDQYTDQTKYALLGTAIAGCAIQTAAVNVAMLIVGRLIAGVALGVSLFQSGGSSRY